MTEDQAREDIAFIRRAIAEGGAYATARSPDMLLWGVAVAIGYLATYAFLRGGLPLSPSAIWAICIGLPWLFSLRRAFGIGGDLPVQGPMVRAFAMLWFGCGIFLTVLAVAVVPTDAAREGWLGPVAAGVMGIGFFASSWLTNLPWLRWVALGWWAGEVVLLVLRHRVEALPLGAALYLLLLALPGYVLLRRGRRVDA